MTSERREEAYVWVFLPGGVSPTLCGRFEYRPAPGGQSVGRFVYGRRFLENRHATALDPVALRLKERLFETTGLAEGVFGVIADACPDNWGRYVIDRQFGVQHYPVGYLLHSQEDRVGNLCFSRGPDVGPELAEPTPRALLDKVWMVIAGLDGGRPIPPDLAVKIRVNTALGGARPKLTVADESAQWLAKFPSHRDDPRWSQARLEAAMLDLARLCGIEAAHAQIHTVTSPEARSADILLVQRFDRTRVAARAMEPESHGDAKAPAKTHAWLRDGFVSARTVMLSTRAAASFGGSYVTLAREMGRWSARAASDRLELFRRMVFNCCISNTDDHDRNHGLLASEDGLAYRLAPAFDMVPRLHATMRRYQAMNIGDRGAEAAVENLLSAAGAFEIELARAREIVDGVQTTVLESWRGCLQGRGLDEQALELLAPCFGPLPYDFVHLDPPRDLADRPPAARG